MQGFTPLAAGVVLLSIHWLVGIATALVLGVAVLQSMLPAMPEHVREPWAS